MRKWDTVRAFDERKDDENKVIFEGRIIDYEQFGGVANIHLNTGHRIAIATDKLEWEVLDGK